MTPDPAFWYTVGAILAGLATVALGGAWYDKRRARKRAACSRHDPRDPYRMKAADRLAFMDIWARAELEKEAGEPS